MEAIEDRAVGAFVGLAVGDALGAPVEFCRRGTFAPVVSMLGGGRFALHPGQWTDDTSMAICLAESLLFDPYLDVMDLAHRFVRWVEDGTNSSTGRCFGVGRQTLQALGRFRRTGNPLAGDHDPRAAGNGSIMRLAPVATLRWHDPTEAARIAASQSLITHGAPEVIACCELLTSVLCRAICGADKNDILSLCASTSWPPTVQAIGAGSWRGKSIADLDSTGHAIGTMESALWSFATTSSFEACLIAAVNLGHDADTVGAVAGQIAGAHYGLGGIHEPWLSSVHRKSDLIEIGRSLFQKGAEVVKRSP
jgi:ADP-ribosyl-[dinitrogen reductase] hydrolase